MASQASADDPASPDYSPQAPGLMTAERLIDEGSKVLDERMRRRLARAAEAVPPERFLENADGCELQSLFDCYCMTVTNRKLWKQKANSLHSLVTVLGIIKNKFGITKIGDEVVCTSQRNGSDLSKEQQLLMLGAYLASEFSQAGACGHDNNMGHAHHYEANVSAAQRKLVNTRAIESDPLLAAALLGWPEVVATPANESARADDAPLSDDEAGAEAESGEESEGEEGEEGEAGEEVSHRPAPAPHVPRPASSTHPLTLEAAPHVAGRVRKEEEEDHRGPQDAHAGQDQQQEVEAHAHTSRVHAQHAAALCRHAQGAEAVGLGEAAVPVQRPQRPAPQAEAPLRGARAARALHDRRAGGFRRLPHARQRGGSWGERGGLGRRAAEWRPLRPDVVHHHAPQDCRRADVGRSAPPQDHPQAQALR